MTAIQKAQELRHQAIMLLFIEREQIAEQLDARRNLFQKVSSFPVMQLGARVLLKSAYSWRTSRGVKAEMSRKEPDQI